jgi:DNA-binding NarL/FixJ family response regulator
LKTRILIADDYDVVRRGIVALLSRNADWEVCGEARSGREAVLLATERKPDVVIMDISMPELNGVDALREILKENPATEVLIFTMHSAEELVRRTLSLGARGYLLKSSCGTELVAAVDAVSRHNPYFSSAIAKTIVRGYLQEPISAEPVTGEPLTPRERQIVQQVAEGRSSKEIARDLNITTRTVDTHRAHIMAKLELRSVPDLVRYAIRNHIVEC